MNALEELVTRLLLGEGLPGRVEPEPKPVPLEVGVEVVFFCRNCESAVDLHTECCTTCGQRLCWLRWVVLS